MLAISARTGAHMQDWFSLLETMQPGSAKAMEIDYDIYADGEALLGWLNATVQINSPTDFEAAELLQALGVSMQTALEGSEIAHLKMTFSPSESLAGEIAGLSIVRSDVVPQLSLHLDSPVRSGQLIVNCRAEGSP